MLNFESTILCIGMSKSIETLACEYEESLLFGSDGMRPTDRYNLSQFGFTFRQVVVKTTLFVFDLVCLIRIEALFFYHYY